jgi:PAS domain S-box-containing protein
MPEISHRLHAVSMARRRFDTWARSAREAVVRLLGLTVGFALGKASTLPLLDFAALRATIILLSYGWLLTAGVPPAEQRAIAMVLHGFTAYSVLLYFLVYWQQRRVMRWNLVVLAVDLGFALALVRITGGAASPFYLALYLIAALQSFYYGIRRGVQVLVASSVLYVATVWPTLGFAAPGVVALRLGFMALIVVTLGVLSQREGRKRRELQDVNRQLEDKAGQLAEAYGRHRDLQDHLQNIMSSITNGIIAVDREGRVTAWNRIVEERNGIPLAQAVGRRLPETLPAFERNGVMEAVQGLLEDRTEAVHLREVEHETLKKGTIIVNVDGYPLRNSSGDLQGAVLVIEDVTTRVELERQMRQSEKLTALGTLSAGLAHEINNPLGIITSRVEVVLMEAEGRDTPKQLIDDLKVIGRHARRAARVAQGLLSFSRQTAWHLVPLDLNEVVEDTLLLIEKQLLKERIALDRRLTPGLPKVMGSQNHLEQVLVNLLNNAREAMPAGGSIRVETRTRPDGKSVQILVADTGSGIPPDQMARIFDPFFTTKEGGTGLGLSISYGIIKDHDGNLAVESEAGKGTTFTISLPVAAR